jgi:hypothetical protein
MIAANSTTNVTRPTTPVLRTIRVQRSELVSISAVMTTFFPSVRLRDTDGARHRQDDHERPVVQRQPALRGAATVAAAGLAKTVSIATVIRAGASEFARAAGMAGNRRNHDTSQGQGPENWPNRADFQQGQGARKPRYDRPEVKAREFARSADPQ